MRPESGSEVRGGEADFHALKPVDENAVHGTWPFSGIGPTMLSIVYSRASGPREIARTYYGAFRMQPLGYVKRKRSALCVKWPETPSDAAGCDTVTTVEPWMATRERGSLTADELIAVLLDQRQHWTYRAWSAMLLASRNEKAVTEALFQATQRDPVYWVRRDAMRSLRLLIGELEYEICPV